MKVECQGTGFTIHLQPQEGDGARGAKGAPAAGNLVTAALIVKALCHRGGAGETSAAGNPVTAALIVKALCQGGSGEASAAGNPLTTTLVVKALCHEGCR